METSVGMVKRCFPDMVLEVVLVVVIVVAMTARSCVAAGGGEGKGVTSMVKSRCVGGGRVILI